MPAGRPTEYEPIFAEEAKELALAGHTMREIAGFLGISINTLYLWKKRYPEFGDALKDWSQEADKRVVDCLYHKATGYSHKVVKPFIDQKSGQIKYAEYEESLPPDPTSMIFWLKNRQPEQWRDRRDSDVTVKGEVSANSVEALAKSIAALADKLTEDEDETD